jgi:hypothetical protein
MRLLHGLSALTIGAAALLSACGPDPELARAVREYDDALVVAYAASDPSGMDRVATRDEADRVRILIDIKAGAKLQLDSRLEDFEVVRTTARGDAATVETRERWRYHDHPLAPGREPGPELLSRMVMRYALVREEGRWKVASAATLSSAYEVPELSR